MKSILDNQSPVELVKEIDAQEISRQWLDELGVSWSPPSGIEKISYWRDLRTGFCFYTPAEVAGDSDLYVQLQRFSWYYMDDKWEFDEALRLIESTARSDYRLLEIGTGRGSFLEKAKSLGISLAGLELNSEAAKFVRDQGFEIYEESLASLASKCPASWDAICSFQVLEHISSPREFIQESLSLLKKDGILILSVPNSEVSRKLDPNCADLLDLPPHHMGHWNAEVFRALEDLFPVRLMWVAFEPLATYHVDWFMHAWKRQLQAKLGYLPSKLVFNRIAFTLFSKMLSLGLRKFVKGHTLLVCLQKLG